MLRKYDSLYRGEYFRENASHPAWELFQRKLVQGMILEGIIYFPAIFLRGKQFSGEFC